MRSIFQVAYKSDDEKAIASLADWLFRYSSALSRPEDSYNSALEMAEAFLKQENSHRIFGDGL